MPVLDGEALEFCCIPQGLASEGPSIGSGPKHMLSAWNRPNDTGAAQRFMLRAALYAKSSAGPVDHTVDV